MKVFKQILSCVIPSPVAGFWRTGRGLPAAGRDLLFTSRASIRIPSFRAERTETFSALPLLRKFGLRSEKSLFVRGMSLALYALLLAFAASAQVPEPMPLAHGNVPGEPHHHLKIENEYVRVYYVEVPPHESTQLHQHDHDYLFVSLGPADVINAVRDKPEIHLQLKDGETHFTRGGFAHVARNLSDAPFRNITIELLKLQDEPKNLCAQIFLIAPVGNCPKSTTPSTSLHTEPLLETRETAVDLVRLDPSLNVASISPRVGFLIVLLGETQIQGEPLNAPVKKVKEGDVIWVPAGSHEFIWNSKGKDLSYLQLTF